MLEFNDVSLKTNKKDKRETMEKRGKNRRIKAVITCSFISYTKIWQTYVDIVIFKTLIFNLFFGNRLTVVVQKKKKVLAGKVRLFETQTESRKERQE